MRKKKKRRKEEEEGDFWVGDDEKRREARCFDDAWWLGVMNGPERERERVLKAALLGDEWKWIRKRRRRGHFILKWHNWVEEEGGWNYGGWRMWKLWREERKMFCESIMMKLLKHFCPMFKKLEMLLQFLRIHFEIPSMPNKVVDLEWLKKSGEVISCSEMVAKTTDKSTHTQVSSFLLACEDTHSFFISDQKRGCKKRRQPDVNVLRLLSPLSQILESLVSKENTKFVCAGN